MIARTISIICIIASLTVGGLVISRLRYLTASAPSDITSQDTQLVTFHRIPPVVGYAGLNIAADLPVYNRNKETLVISKVIPSCGCTSAVLSAQEIIPGNSAQLHVEVQIPPEGASKDISIQLEDRDGIVGIHRFTATGYPYVKVDDELGMVVFGRVLPNKVSTRTVPLLLYSTDERHTPKVTSVISQSPSVIVTRFEPFARTRNSKEGVQCSEGLVELELTPSSVPGVGMGNLQITYDVDSQSHGTSVSMSWEVVPVVTCAPSRLFLMLGDEHLQPGSRLTRKAVLTSNDKTPFDIKQVETPSWVVASQLTQLSPTSAMVVLEIDPLTVSDRSFAELRIHTSHPSQSAVLLPVSLLSRSKGAN